MPKVARQSSNQDEQPSSLSRKSFRRTRTSIVPRYSIVNPENTISNREVDESDQNDALEFLVNKAISQLCRVSPLHGLDYSKTKLKQYALKMKQYLANNIKSNIVFMYSVEITVLDNLKLEVRHPDALKIAVWGTNEDENVKLLYCGVLLSWCDEVEASNNSTHLPLLVERGGAKVAGAVRHILAKIFDCHIAPLTFTQSHLLLFTALLSGSHSHDDGARQVSFVYNVPYTMCATKLTVDIHLEDIYYFWKQCFGENEVIQYDETSARRLYEEFQKHIMSHHSIDVGLLHLQQLTHPRGLVLRSSGHVRLGNMAITRLTLRALCQMATLLKTVTPSLGTDVIHNTQHDIDL